MHQGSINLENEQKVEQTIIVRYAETDADVVAIHGFLCVVAGPTLPGVIDPKDSATEVWRIVNHDVALMAIKEDRVVGTIGLVNPRFWWNSKLSFLANCWLFTLPDSGSLLPLMREAVGIAKASGLELHIFDETKERLLIFNKSKKRQPAFANAPKSS
jgi:hypothetical protein